MAARKRWELPCDLLVLAATDRAERHATRHGVMLREIAGHLGLEWNSVTSRRLRPFVRLANELGWLEQDRRRGSDVYTVTAVGAERLAGRFPDGADDALPESPQHREWREAKAHAARRIEELRTELSTRLDEVAALLGAAEPPTSDDWLILAEPVMRAIRRVGFATYCLREWVEPDDARADRDETAGSAFGRVSRRRYRVWDSDHLRGASRDATNRKDLR